MSALFQPLAVKSLTLRNRIAVPPMCQYMAEDGFASDWHRAHYGALGQGGAALVIVEATGVSPEGRITPGCLGLWSDAHTPGFAELARLIKANGAVAGIQIGHAGRKASSQRPWEGGNHIAPDAPTGWQTIAPSPIPFGANQPLTPQEMSLADIARVQGDFVAAAKRALEAGFEWLELHFAHGYLGQSFASRHSNTRSDAYGQQRDRFLLETVEAVRKVWPEHLPLTARFGVIEYDGHDEDTLAASMETARGFKARGLDLLSVSIGFSTAAAQIPWGETGFLAPVAKRLREESGLLTSTAWGFDAPKLAEATIESGAVDLIQIGKAHLANPHWSYFAATQLGLKNPANQLPPSYAYWLARYRRAE